MSIPLKILNENEIKSISNFNSNKDKNKNSYNNYGNSFMSNTYKNNAYNYNNNYNANKTNPSFNSNLTNISKNTKKENGIRIKTHKERMKENSSNENLLLKNNVEDEKYANGKTNYSDENKKEIRNENENSNIDMNIGGFYDNRNMEPYERTEKPDTGAGVWDENPGFWEDDDGPPGKKH